MTDDVGNLILERLRRMDDRLGNIEADVQNVKTRMSALDEHMNGMLISLTAINTRMDRFDERLSRVERRLELSDAR